MPLLAATSAFGLGEDAGVLLNSVVYTVSVPTRHCSKEANIFTFRTKGPKHTPAVSVGFPTAIPAH